MQATRRRKELLIVQIRNDDLHFGTACSQLASDKSFWKVPRLDQGTVQYFLWRSSL